MKVLLYGDLQINYAYPEYMRYMEGTVGYLLELIAEHKPDLVVNLGDTTDTHGIIDLKSIVQAHDWMRDISLATRAAGSALAEPHLILKGNHDISDKDGEIASIRVMDDDLTRVVMNAEMIRLTDSVSIACFPFTNDYDKTRAVLAEHGSSATLMVGHLDWAGIQLTPAFVSKSGLCPTAYTETYGDIPFFNGHYHNPLQAGSVRFTGSPLYKDFNDVCQEIPRGFDLFDTDTKEITRLINPHTYLLDTLKTEDEKELVEWLGSRNDPASTKVRVYLPKDLVVVAEGYRGSFLWMGIHPTDHRVSIEHKVSVSLDTTSTEIIKSVVDTAPSEYDAGMLSEIGERLFA